MNWEAAILIGGLALAAGVVLYIPGHFLARWLLRRSEPSTDGRLSITPAGFIFYGAMVLVMTLGVSTQYLAPGTSIGRLVSTWEGLLLFLVGVSVIATAVEKILAGRGVRLVVRQQDA